MSRQLVGRLHRLVIASSELCASETTVNVNDSSVKQRTEQFCLAPTAIVYTAIATATATAVSVTTAMND